MNMDIAYVAAITVISYLVAQSVKASGINNKWIPVICGVCGGVLGYIALKVMPGFPVNDPLSAVAVGIVSGLAATGSHELIKQILEGKADDGNQS